MKKTLTLMLVFLAWTTSLSAQTTREQADVPQGVASSYLPIITPDKIWHIETGYACPEPCPCYYGLRTIKIGDTKTLNEKEYYELMFDDQSIITYIREEAGKLFFYSEYCNEEYLMYDFTLNVGDTFFFYDPYDPWPNPCELTEEDILWYSFVVGETSEIEYNQVERKKIRLDWLLFPDGFQDTWVEGIGNMRGICFHSAQQLTGFRRLKDCYESDQLIFKNEEPFCWFYVGTNDRQEELINIFADESNTLRIVNAKDIPLTMYDIQGRNIKSIIPTEDNYALNISNLPKGLYIVGNETKGITFKVVVR